MLELKNIQKDYPAGDGVVHALRGIDIQFRKNEFVAILGQSGCGKTTMLNIIGGLDQYTAGDLIINGRSTKDFKDRDWDAYRNHSVGFVFQSYNLIPHQSVLRNVELALTLSGVHRSERRKRAIEALESVGLGDQLKKKPAQMSGGQMQRVAIARALVNNPDIILADGPTGALDSETSVQVMEILKEVAKERLVVMVTHNPDLADLYATRTIRMLDGELIGDSNPLTDAELQKNREEDAQILKNSKKTKKPSMKWQTAFGLSLNNLIAKRGRTTLTSFAGSIGIIGIALIYAVSQGTTNYINSVQEETLSSYPLMIERATVNLGNLLTALSDSAESHTEHDKDAVYSKSVAYELFNALNSVEAEENDLASFKEFIETQIAQEDSELSQSLTGVRYSYDLDMLVYTKSVDGTIIESDAEKLMGKLMGQMMGVDMSGVTASGGSGLMGMGMSSMMSSSSYSVWDELLPGTDGQTVNDLVKKQYDVIYGEWPNDYNEIVLVVDSLNEVDDYTLYALGLKSESDMMDAMDAVMNGEMLEVKTESWSYEEICDMEFRVVFPGDCYVLDPASGLCTDLRLTEAGERYLYDNGTKLRVTGIIRPNENTSSPMISGSIAYTAKLTEYVIEQSRQSGSVQAQIADPSTDIITGLPFKSTTGSLTNAQKAAELRAHVAELEQKGKAELYVKIMCIPSQETLDASVAQMMGDMTVEQMRQTLQEVLVTQMGVSEQDVQGYLEARSDEEITAMYTELIIEQVKMQYAAQTKQQLAQLSQEQLSAALDASMATYTEEQLAQYYDEALEFSESTYEDNLIELGCLDVENPSRISLYASSFDGKEIVEDAIASYNDGKEEQQKIKYTDYIALMMGFITTTIDAITYVLIAFVAISLVVSSIMIGVITLISVQERTKEIGVLRAIGASKKNVSSMFNAETVMIGAASGLIGVGVTYVLCIPINAIIFALTDIAALKAQLPLPAALILVAISILLSVFSGFIPSRSAAKKDPVVALRTE